ncbi:MAG: hypothetical protein KJ749_12250, partial [Planctomycetes bacterium]|nr:hypothetical protein [Planctomycetota bacterium]
MNRVCVVLLLLTAAGPLGEALADPLSIYEIQSNTYDGDGSNYDGAVIDCAGGVVVAKFPGYRPRVILQDPAQPAGWGGIQVKDWTLTDLYSNVEIGDRVQLYNVEVEESRGNTLLQWYAVNDPSFAILSRGNPVPEPILLGPVDISAPLEDPPGEWYVLNHDAEPYEAMRVVVRDVTVTRMNLGKAVDNYNLQDSAENDCWAADYMNDE